MRTMTWEEIDKDWGGLQKRHRMEIAQAVARYCVGHRISEVAEHLGYDRKWVNEQLTFAGIAKGIGGDVTRVTSDGPPELGSHTTLRPAIQRVVDEFAPEIKVRFSGQDKSGIAEVAGADAEDFEPYIDHYLKEGYEPSAAVRLASAEWAAEAATEAGVIKEDHNKRNERVNRIEFPEDEGENFELELKLHAARVRAAAAFLDKAKVPFLRRKSTLKEVASAHAKWSEQVDRIRNFHPTFGEVV